MLLNTRRTHIQNSQQVPYETLRKHFRNSQKQIEREFGAIQSTSADLAKPRPDDRDQAEAAKAVDAMIARVEGLKKKVCVYLSTRLIRHALGCTNA